MEDLYIYQRCILHIMMRSQYMLFQAVLTQPGKDYHSNNVPPPPLKSTYSKTHNICRKNYWHEQSTWHRSCNALLETWISCNALLEAWMLADRVLDTWKLNGCSSCALAVHQACKKRHAITIVEFVLSVNKQCWKQEPFLFQKIEPLCHPSHQLTFFLFVVSFLESAACRFLCLFSSAFCFSLA